MEFGHNITYAKYLKWFHAVRISSYEVLYEMKIESCVKFYPCTHAPKIFDHAFIECSQKDQSCKVAEA